MWASPRSLHSVLAWRGRVIELQAFSYAPLPWITLLCLLTFCFNFTSRSKPVGRAFFLLRCANGLGIDVMYMATQPGCRIGLTCWRLHMKFCVYAHKCVCWVTLYCRSRLLRPTTCFCVSVPLCEYHHIFTFRLNCWVDLYCFSWDGGDNPRYHS
jgi:hypothetical protein